MFAEERNQYLRSPLDLSDGIPELLLKTHFFLPQLVSSSGNTEKTFLFLASNQLDEHAFRW
jgi:hypothetical protein